MKEALALAGSPQPPHDRGARRDVVLCALYADSLQHYSG